MLIVPSCDGAVYALNRRTGRRIWRFSAAKGAYHSSPVTQGKTVFVGNDDGHLYALNEVSGSERWRADLRAPVWADPLLAPGVVVAATLSGHIFAVRHTDGAILWRHEAGRCIYLSTLHAWRDMVVAGTTNGNLVAVDLETGKRAWTMKAGGKVAGGPSREEDVFYVCTTGGICVALDLARKRRLWTRRLRGGTLYPPAVTSGSIIVGTGAGLFYALDRKDGRTLWTHRTRGRAGCVSADGRIAVACSWGGDVHAIAHQTGEALWTLKTDCDVRGFPTLNGGWLYIGSLDKSLYAVKYA